MSTVLSIVFGWTCAIIRKPLGINAHRWARNGIDVGCKAQCLAGEMVNSATFEISGCTAICTDITNASSTGTRISRRHIVYADGVLAASVLVLLVS